MSENPWIEWTGGHRPVHPDTMVEYVMRDDNPTALHIDPAHNLRWDNAGKDSYSDIVRYRVHKPDMADEPPATAPNGLNGSYYDVTLADGRNVSAADVIDALGLNFNQGNILKSVWRMGRKPGVSERYDAEKVVYYGTRELRRVGG